MSNVDLITLADVNARAMTTEALRVAWNDAYSTSMNARTRQSRRIWADVRDIFGRELDRRETPSLPYSGPA